MQKVFAWALIPIGCAGLWKIVTNSVNRVLCYFAISTQLWKNVTGEIPQVVFCHYYLYRCADDKGQEAAAGG